MRVLAHIHTFNDADIIDLTIEAVRRQTRRVDEILVVDNASTDNTVERALHKDVTVVREQENVGTSGAVVTGFRYALERNYDWIWIFDADSAPEPDALEKLLDLYAGLPQALRDQTAFLACLAHNSRDGEPVHGQIFTKHGIDIALPPPGETVYPCHATIWSGCFYRVTAIRHIGVPNADYVLDVGDCEYGYRVMKAGYKGFIDSEAVLNHNIRGGASLQQIRRKYGPFALTIYDFPPIRCYYACRNALYFALYDIAEGRFEVLLRTMPGLTRLTLNFLLRPLSRGKQLRACFCGMWHGVTGNIAARY
jgi:GT2 family glycosyltransferase